MSRFVNPAPFVDRAARIVAPLSTQRWGVKLWIVVGGMAASILVLFIPVYQRTITTLGVDEYEAHRPLFGTQTQSQEVAVSRELHGVGAILVNLRRAAAAVPVEVTVFDVTTGQLLAQATITPEAIIDDQFAMATFRESLQGHQTVRVTFAAPQATSANPIGIRLNPDTVPSAGVRFENDEAQLGTLAIALQERVSLWRFMYTLFIQNPERAQAVAYALLAALVIAGLTLRPGWNTRDEKQTRRIEIALLVLVAVAALTVRLVTIPYFFGVSGGDPYNYLFITQKLTALENPFEGVKRLPGFPLLLTPAFLTDIDDIWWMRFISSLAAGISILLLGILARRLRLPWAVQIMAVALLALHKDFLWTSFRPEAYTVYTALLLGSLVLFFCLRARWAQVLFGIVLGYAAMTRQEGFVLAAVLGVASLSFWRQVFVMPAKRAGWRGLLPQRDEILPLIKALAATYLPGLLIVAPFFLNNLITFGNPLYTEYFAGERLQIVDSWNAFLDSAGATWGVLGSMWRPSWDQLFRLPLTDPYFVGAVLFTLLWWLLQYASPTRLARGVPRTAAMVWLVVGGCAVVVAVTNRALFDHVVMASTAGILVASIVPLLLAAKWRGGVLVAVAASQILIALWFHPFPKHYQQAYPLLVLAFTVALVPLSRYRPDTAGTLPEIPTFTTRVSMLVPLALVIMFLFSSLNTYLDKYNHATALDNVIYRAVQQARDLPGQHGFDQAYLVARLYFIDDAAYYTADEEKVADRKLQWIVDNNIRTFITTNASQTPLTPLPHWKRVISFRAEGRDEFVYESVVYEIPRN